MVYQPSSYFLICNNGIFCDGFENKILKQIVIKLLIPIKYGKALKKTILDCF